RGWAARRRRRLCGLGQGQMHPYGSCSESQPAAVVLSLWSGWWYRRVGEVGGVVDDRSCYLGEQSVVVAGVGAHQRECLGEADVLAFGEDAFGLFDQHAAIEGDLELFGDHLAVSQGADLQEAD